jgi:hypothetical protein
MKNMKTDINGECVKRYGSAGNVKHPKWENKINALKEINPNILELGQPTDLAFHNLSNTDLPTGAQRLLGHSLKFCIAEQRPTPAIEATLQRMQCSIRIRHWIDNELPVDTDAANDNYIPTLYLPSNWNPPRASPGIERRILSFENELRKEIKRQKPSRSSNLDFYQNRALKML